MSKIQKEIQNTLEEISNLDRVRSHYDQSVAELRESQSKIKGLENRLNKELKEFEAIESNGLKSVFYKVLGSREEQVEKERQDYLDASLRYNEHKKSIELLEFEIKLLEKKLGNTNPLHKKIEKLKQKRENEILKTNPKLAEKLIGIAKETDQYYVYHKELKEAYVVGEKVVKSLENMVKELNKAKDWGNWDMMGRSRSAGFNKHSAIDRAKNISVWVKHELLLFNKELADVGHNDANFNLNMNNFSKFTDIFFDNLISDWIIQQRIVNALSNTVSVRDRVVLILRSLAAEVDKANLKIDQLKENRNKLLLQ